MSNASISLVTVALRNLLKKALGSSLKVTLLQPGEDFSGNGVNLFLYRVAESPQVRNMDWPGDRISPAAPHRFLALDLYYLLTPYGQPADPEADDAPAHRILGQSMQVLHDHPSLNDFHSSIFDADDNSDFAEELRNSFAKIIVRLNPAGLDELAKIWTTISKPYRLSVSYEVSLALIPPALPAAAQGAPVLRTGVEVITTDPPQISALDRPGGGTGGTLTIQGFRFTRRGLKTAVIFGGQTLAPDSATLTETTAQIIVPEEFDAGPEQVVRVKLGAMTSAPQTYRIEPWVTSAQPIRAAIDSSGATRVTLSLVGRSFSGAAVSVLLSGTPVPGSPLTVPGADVTVVDDTLVQAILPNNLGNGSVKVQIQAGAARGNARTIEIVPLLETLTPATAAAGGALALAGQRFAGADGRVDIGPASIAIGAPGGSPINVNIPKTLPPGDYDVRYTVDGHGSNVRTLKVTS